MSARALALAAALVAVVGDSRAAPVAATQASDLRPPPVLPSVLPPAPVVTAVSAERGAWATLVPLPGSEVVHVNVSFTRRRVLGGIEGGALAASLLLDSRLPDGSASLADALARVGAYGSASWEWAGDISLTIDAQPESLEACLRATTDVLLHGTPASQATFERRRAWSADQGFTARLGAAFWWNRLLGPTALATAMLPGAAIDATRKLDARALFDALSADARAGGLRLSVAGPVTAEQVAKAMRAAPSVWAAKPEATTTSPRDRRGAWIVAAPTEPLVHVQLKLPVYDTRTVDGAAAAIVAGMLDPSLSISGGLGSYLRQVDVLAPASGYQTYDVLGPAPFALASVAIAPKDADAFMRALDATRRSLADWTMGDEGTRWLIERRREATHDTGRSPDDALHVARQAHYAPRMLDRTRAVADASDRVTVADVRRVAKALFAAGDLAVVVYGAPDGWAERLAAAHLEPVRLVDAATGKETKAP